MNLRNKFFILLPIGVFLTGQWGCVVGPTVYPKSDPLLEEYREQLGTIGVTTTSEIPNIQIDGPPTGFFERTGQGISEGANKSAK